MKARYAMGGGMPVQREAQRQGLGWHVSVDQNTVGMSNSTLNGKRLLRKRVLRVIYFADCTFCERPCFVLRPQNGARMQQMVRVYESQHQPYFDLSDLRVFIACGTFVLVLAQVLAQLPKRIFTGPAHSQSLLKREPHTSI